MRINYIPYDDLQPGDLLFVVTSSDLIKESVAACYSGHVQIFTGEPLNPTVHAVTEGKYSGTRATRLDNEVNYMVIRCNDPAIRTRATQLALHWAAYQLPYDLQRQQEIADLSTDVSLAIAEKGLSGSQAVIGVNKSLTEKASEAFRSSGIYKLIKYASRRDTAAMLPDELGGKRGFRCAMFACLIYQIASLGSMIKSRDLSTQGWSSDKYAHPQAIAQLAPPKNFDRVNPFYFYRRRQYIHNYQQYVESVQTRQHKKHAQVTKQIGTHDHSNLKPAVEAWDFKRYGDPAAYNYDAVLPPSLQVDPTLVTSGSFWYSITQDPPTNGFWTIVGVLPKEEIPTPDAAEKDAARADLRQRATEGNVSRAEVATTLKPSSH